MENEDMYHYDFTTASELEIFIARIEEIIQEWRVPQKPVQCKLEKDDFKKKEWCLSSEKITFADVEFQLNRYYLKCSEDKDTLEERKGEVDDGSISQAIEDMLSLENDFFPITVPPTKDSHPLARWYGLRDFLVLVPKLSVLVASESQIKLWLSSLCIATSNTGCQVPVFLQAKEPWQCYFLGVCQSKGFHTDFEMIHLEHLPLHCQYLTGLLTLFKSKISTKLISTPVTISVRCTYVLKDWTLSTWTQNPPDLGFLEGEDIGVSELSKLPFGAVYDPILGLNLRATWPHLVENTIVDSESYSDLDPMHALVWTASINVAENANCLLTEYFTEFLSLCNNNFSIQEILESIVDTSSSKSSDLSSSLSAITESKISAFSKAVIGSDKNSRKQSHQVEQFEGPISSDILMTLLYFLFPDADAECKSPYPEQYSGNSNPSTEEDKSVNSIDPRLSGMKSAPYNSLPWRLAIVMAHVIHSLGGVQSATHLWYEFTKELRYRCERNILIPG
ncbi:UNVERIFIED_CONTAM: hypothetical protein PYX00_006319 [Menopon gallinae]|uniref:Rab3 GTPase-activating protein catalytic subunit n=1 Tax=Menopon gallinae TaxID=328185 RepID=A0AAW2HUR0_9NEOP